MSNATEFNKGFQKTCGGCSAVLLFVFAIIFGTFLIICGGLASRSPAPYPTAIGATHR